jgi:prevent-host-death family protein
MKIAPVAELKAQFSAYLKSSTEGPIVVTRHGKPVAVLLSIEDEDELERLVLAYTPKFQGILEAAREQIRETGGIGHEEFWHDMEAEGR